MSTTLPLSQMRRINPWKSALAAATLVTLVAATPSAALSAETVTIVRGSDTETVRPGIAGWTSGVAIQRGTKPSSNEISGRHHHRHGKRGWYKPIVTGGDYLWLVGADGRTVTACAVMATATYGRNVIQCWDRRFRHKLYD